MKLLTFSLHDHPRFGALVDETTVIDLDAGNVAMTGKSAVCLKSALDFLNGGPEARAQAEKVVEFVTTQCPLVTTYPLAAVSLLAPVPRPLSIRDCMAFEKHIQQATRTVIRWRAPRLARLNDWVAKWRGRPLIGVPAVWYERPLYYHSNPSTVVGPEAEIKWPQYTEKLDYELELGIFIGRVGKNISKACAAEWIAGYTIFNDFSARDIQMREMQGHLGPAKGKNFDTSNAMGPYLVTADELPDPYHLTMIARVNDEEWSRGYSGEMFFDFAEIIAYLSQDETLQPGDFIGSGTVGNGCGLELDRWLKPGDIVELEIEKLGILRNRVVKIQ